MASAYAAEGGAVYTFMKHNWKIRLVVLASLLAMLLPATRLQAQDNTRSQPIPNTIWVGADGKFETDPDTALLQFNISAQEEKLDAANERATKAAEQIRQLLRTNGLDPKDAEISRFAVEPVYDYKNPKRKLVGYRVDSNISIKVKDFSKIGPLTVGLSNMDVTGNQSLSYQLDDMDAAKIKAVEDALRKTHDEAAAVARASGRSLGELSYASVDTYESSPIRPQVFTMAKISAGVAAPSPAPAEEFGAQKITVTAHVNALYGLK